jgi:hypothetical protein
MTTSTNRPMLARRQPARAACEHEAAVLAAARGLEAESRDPEAVPAVDATLACVEASLDALAQATARLGDHVVGRWAEADTRTSLARGGAIRAFRRLQASLKESSAACVHARDMARPLREGAGATDEGALQACG